MSPACRRACAVLACALLLALVLVGPVSSQAGTPTPAPSPAPTAAPAVIAQPVVVVGYGEGARGVDLAILAVLFCGFGAVILVLLFQFLGGKA